ncbi:YmfQ family protein [Solibacillus sp. MA9]|uniref:YmfQ family protein n=1 Tax=Solibacillus palustris TaxID=2908203 RepID=A0ABS9UC24_9BACL|nr:putative phage tail protein [Solibacillus sp. MA9]MCH7321793.1 YmfQ family protein [Solibacillus sp. MA9]
MYEPLTYEVDVQRHYPSTINDFEEIIEICKVENSNFNQVRVDLLKLFRMRFIHETDVSGISRWENLLKMKRRPSDSLEVRRMRVLAKINNKLPYTWRSVQQLLNSILGIDNYHLNLNPQKFEVELLLPIEIGQYREVFEILEPMLPMNIWLTIAEGMVREIIQIFEGAYGWEMNPNVCGRFRTASRPGHAQGLPTYQVESPYDWSVTAPITGKFRAGGKR